MALRHHLVEPLQESVPNLKELVSLIWGRKDKPEWRFDKIKFENNKLILSLASFSEFLESWLLSNHNSVAGSFLDPFY